MMMTDIGVLTFHTVVQVYWAVIHWIHVVGVGAIRKKCYMLNIVKKGRHEHSNTTVIN